MAGGFALRRVLPALTGAATAVAGYHFVTKEYKAEMSWTNNSTPSVPWDWNWDKRQISSLMKKSKSEVSDSNIDTENLGKALKSTATRHLIFIRHGQYNLEGATDNERYLTKLGHEQAALTGDRLKALDLPISRLVYSTMTRATETAEIILKSIDVKEVEKCYLLQEGAPIPPEPPVGSWKPEMHKFYTDGARIEAAFRQYFHRAPASQTETSYEVFVCHANVIRYFACRALQLPPEAWLRFSLHNGSITHFTIRPDGRVGIRKLGESGYMEPSKLTFN